MRWLWKTLMVTDTSLWDSVRMIIISDDVINTIKSTKNVRSTDRGSRSSFWVKLVKLVKLDFSSSEKSFQLIKRKNLSEKSSESVELSGKRKINGMGEFSGAVLPNKTRKNPPLAKAAPENHFHVVFVSLVEFLVLPTLLLQFLHTWLQFL